LARSCTALIRLIVPERVAGDQRFGGRATRARVVHATQQRRRRFTPVAEKKHVLAGDEVRRRESTRSMS